MRRNSRREFNGSRTTWTPLPSLNLHVHVPVWRIHFNAECCIMCWLHHLYSSTPSQLSVHCHAGWKLNSNTERVILASVSKTLWLIQILAVTGLGQWDPTVQIFFQQNVYSSIASAKTTSIPWMTSLVSYHWAYKVGTCRYYFLYIILCRSGHLHQVFSLLWGYCLLQAHL